jgi:hypothetical protein
MRMLTFSRDGAGQVGALARDGRTVAALAAAGRARDGHPAPADAPRPGSAVGSSTAPS